MMNRLILLVYHLLFQVSFLSSVLLTTTTTTFVVVDARGHHNNNNNNKWEEHAQVTGWDESFAAFVPYPPKALEGLPYEEVDELTTLTLDIVVNVAQWDQPIFAILKGIVNRNFRIKTTNHFFIQDGWIYNHSTGVTSECRRPKKKNDQQHPQTTTTTTTTTPQGETAEVEEIEYEPVGWENCTRHCTNGGRYCLNHLDIPGAPLVKEAARRMCFDYYLEPGSTVLWDYMDRFEDAKCRDDGVDMTACSLEVIDKMNNFNKSNVVDCIYWWGNFDVDHKQQGLQHELHSERVLNVNQKRATKDLPLLFIESEQYKGKYAVKEMFQAICNTFPADEQKPYACEYCSKCKDVRKCLWTLECDGKPLDTSVFHPLPAPTKKPSPYDEQFENLPDRLPTKAPTTTTAVLKDSSGGGKKNWGAFHQSLSSSGNGGISFWHVGILWGAIICLLVAMFYAYRGYRRRSLMKQLANNRRRLRDDDATTRNNTIDALVDALDGGGGITTDDNETCSLSNPSSSSSSSSQPPSSSASSSAAAYTDDDYYDEDNTSDGDEEEEEEEEDESSSRASGMDGSSSSHNNNWNDTYGDDECYDNNNDEECGDSTPLTDYSSLNNQGGTNDWSSPFTSTNKNYSDNAGNVGGGGGGIRVAAPRKTFDDITSAPTMSGISFTSSSKSKKKTSATTKKDKKDKRKKKKKSKSSSSSSGTSSSRTAAPAASAASAAAPMNEDEEMKWVLQRAGKKLRKDWTKQEGELV